MSSEKNTENNGGLKGLRESYRASLKSSDTEEAFDLIFYRPIGFAWAILCRRLGIRPNAITIASIFLGVGAGVMFYFNNLWLNVIGMFLLVWANSFDSADGQLARLTKQYSPLGRILDGLSGDLWFISIYVCICLREVQTSPFFILYPALIWIMASLAGICHGIQAAQADYYRQFHLFFVKGAELSELDSSDQLKEKKAALSWRKNFFPKLIQFFYCSYTIAQERRTPTMQALRAQMRKCFPDGKIPAAFSSEFRRLSKPLMKYTNILSFNTRCFALFISIFIKMPWIYFAFELTFMNALLVYMMWRHERICARLLKDLKDGKY